MKPSWALVYLISEWTIRLGMLIYVPQRRAAAAARAWLVFIFLVPWAGLAVYLLIGRIWLPSVRRRRREVADERVRSILREIEGPAAAPCTLEPPDLHVARLAERLGGFGPLAGNQIELLPDYDGVIDRLIADIDAARSHVHLLFYIFAPDQTGRRVAEAVERAARRGVACRVLMDALGSAAGLRRLGPGLRAAGAEVIATLPVGLFRGSAARADLRNHRKIACVDGEIGYVGSQNIVGPVFIRDRPNEELMARVRGPIVLQLEAVLLADRFEETGQRPPPEQAPRYPGPEGSSVAQVLPSGPGYRHENHQALLCSLLSGANERVVITTPYFVPDEPFLLALETAVVRGAEVHLIVPERSNKAVTKWAQRSHYERLLEAGVHIHLYAPRFLHAKHVTVDRRIAIIGSVNIDIRSFELDCEISLLVYDRAVVAALEAIETAHFAASRELAAADWDRRPLVSRVVENTARLADTLL
ncbi:MAG TPA: cardiolipin synthase [Polyangia bacterium]|nr:cardiolipin synthase [Polyangia bacterium]